MNQKNRDELKEILSKITDNVISSDLNNGKRLLQSCIEYEQCYKNTGITNCNLYNQKNQVLNFINDINARYSGIISIYNKLNDSEHSGNNTVSCNSIVSYVEFLNKVKKSKEIIDDSDKIIKVFKEGIYEQ